jgi:hypothetical protein
MKFSNAIILAAIAACAGLSSSAVTERQSRRVFIAFRSAASAAVESAKFLESASTLRRRQLRKLQEDEEDAEGEETEELPVEEEEPEPVTPEEETEPEPIQEEPTEEEETEEEAEETGVCDGMVCSVVDVVSKNFDRVSDAFRFAHSHKEDETDEVEGDEEGEDEAAAAIPTEARECQSFSKWIIHAFPLVILLWPIVSLNYCSLLQLDDKINLSLNAMPWPLKDNKSLKTSSNSVSLPPAMVLLSMFPMNKRQVRRMNDSLPAHCFDFVSGNHTHTMTYRFPRVETNTTETETEVGFDVRFDKLIEYKKGSFTDTNAEEDEQDEVDVAGGDEANVDGEEAEDPIAEVRQAGGGSSPVDNAFQFESDTIIQEWDLNDWTKLSPVTTSTNGNLLTFSATALGIADFTFTIAQATDGAISANSMKIDVTIEDFPWTEPGTYIALLSHVDTENDVEVKEDARPDAEEVEDTEEAGVEDTSMMGPSEAIVDFSQIGGLLGYEAFGRYSWAPTAEATTVMNSTDGRALQITNNIQVVATIKEGDEGMYKQDIAFSFVGAGASGADRIYWDPETGIGYVTEESASTVGGSSTDSSAVAFKFGTLALAAIAVPALAF